MKHHSVFNVWKPHTYYIVTELLPFWMTIKTRIQVMAVSHVLGLLALYGPVVTLRVTRFQHPKILRPAHCVCVLYASQNNDYSLTQH